MAGYTETIRRYAMDNRFAGEISNADGIGEVGLGAEEAGKKLAVRFSLSLSEQKIQDVRFKVFGCGFTIAACAAAAKLAKGQPLDKVRRIDAQKIDAILKGLPAERDYCADLAAKALQAAVTSTGKNGTIVQNNHHAEEQGSRISENAPVYRLLMDSPIPGDVFNDDRKLFAGLLASAAGEPYSLACAVGLTEEKLELLLHKYFPGIRLESLLYLSVQATEVALEVNSDIRDIIRSHVPLSADEASEWMADILAARAAHPGHLWVAMGLFARPELTVAIQRHLPSLAEANNRNMRWKRYFFKQACELNGGVMCKSPNCGDCSDYSICFVED